MSSNNNNTTATVEATGLLGKIMKILKLDEAGKIESFLAKERKICEKAIKGLGQNKAAIEFDFNNQKDELNEKIQDAKEAYDNAFTNVTLKDVETNEAMSSFHDKFWQNVERKFNTLRALEEELKDLVKRNEEDLKELKEQVEKYNDRISKLK